MHCHVRKVGESHGVIAHDPAELQQYIVRSLDLYIVTVLVTAQRHRHFYLELLQMALVRGTDVNEYNISGAAHHMGVCLILCSPTSA